MATEYKLSYTASEINRKLATVDETKSSLENNYYTSTEIDTKLETKADLVDGKVPLEQLPDDIGGGATSWNDLEDKPFEEVSPAQTITWDGNIEGLLSVQHEFDWGSITYVKLSDEFISKDILLGCKYQLYDYGDEYTENVTEDLLYDKDLEWGQVSSGSYWMNTWIANVESDNETMYSLDYEVNFTFPEKGTWVQMTQENGEIVRFFKYLKVPSIIKTLDPKYLPQGGFGYETTPFEDITWDGNTDGLPVVSEEIDLDGGILNLNYYKVSDLVLNADDMLGCEYTVYDSEEWSSTVEDGEIMSETASGSFMIGVNIAIVAQDGDTLIVDEGNVDDGYLNCPMTFPSKGVWFVYYTIDGESAQCKAFKSSAQITQIDPKFLPTNQPNGIAGLDSGGKISRSQLTIDNSVTSSSSNPVSSSAVYTAIANKQITVDSFVQNGSNNAVSGRAVYNALGGRSQLTIDSSITSSSANPVSSSAVYTVLQNYYTRSETGTVLNNKQDKIFVTSSDDGKFMRVVNGVWAAVTVPNAEDGEF